MSCGWPKCASTCRPIRSSCSTCSSVSTGSLSAGFSRIRPSRTRKCAAFTHPATRASPSPTTASIAVTWRLDVTGSAVNMTPAAWGATIFCTTTASWTDRWSKPC
ncbi:hypothetical protein D3C78_1715810 [compost metagenome]